MAACVAPAARSQGGTSFALLQTLPAGKWQMNISLALMLEYEAKLKTEALRQGRPLAVVDRFLDFLVSVSNRRQTYFLLHPFLRDPGDDFVIELAVASRAGSISQRRHGRPVQSVPCTNRGSPRRWVHCAPSFCWKARPPSAPATCS
jgi:predicted nucleic acid-binding protein